MIVESKVAVLVASVRRIVGNDHDAEDVVQEMFAEAYRIRPVDERCTKLIPTTSW